MLSFGCREASVKIPKPPETKVCLLGSTLGKKDVRARVRSDTEVALRISYPNVRFVF